MSATRRDLLRGALAGGTVTLGLGLTAETAFAGAVDALEGAKTNGQVLYRLLAFEQLEIYCYRHIERTSVLSDVARATVAHFLSHERRHAALLSAELKKRGISSPTPPSSVSEADRRLEELLVARRLDEADHEPAAVHLLIGIETAAETIYHFAIEKVAGALPELAGRILGCEAQHWTGLSSLLHKGNPVLAVPGQFVPFATHSS